MSDHFVLVGDPHDLWGTMYRVRKLCLMAQDVAGRLPEECAAACDGAIRLLRAVRYQGPALVALQWARERESDEPDLGKLRVAATMALGLLTTPSWMAGYLAALSGVIEVTQHASIAQSVAKRDGVSEADLRSFEPVTETEKLDHRRVLIAFGLKDWK